MAINNEAVLEIAREVHRMAALNGGDRRAAIEKYARELRPSGPAALRRLWDDGFGEYAIKRAEMEVLNKDPGALNGAADDDLPENWGTSRWDDIDPLGVLMAVGSTGRLVVLGDATKEDLLEIAAYREKLGTTLLRQAAAIRAMARKVHAGQTLRDALPKLSDGEIEVIEEIAKRRFAAEGEGAA